MSNNKPDSKINILYKLFLEFDLFIKIKNEATMPNTKMYVCLIDLLKSSFALLIDEASEQLNVGKT